MKNKFIIQYLIKVLVILILMNMGGLGFYAAQEKTAPENAAYLTEMAKSKMEEALLAYNGANYPNKPLWLEAIEYGEKAIKTNPDYIEGHYYLAQIYQYTNWYFKEAREWSSYIELIKKDNVISSQVEEKLAYAYFRLGYSAYQREEYDICINYIEEAVKINPEMIEAHYWLGRVFYEIGRLNDSYSSWRKVLKIDPQYPRAEYFLNKVEKAIQFGKDAYESYEAGFKLYEQKLYEDAINKYRLAVNRNKDFSVAYYWLGRIYFEMGNYKEAQNNWKQVLRLEPGNLDAMYWLNQSEKQLK